MGGPHARAVHAQRVSTQLPQTRPHAFTVHLVVLVRVWLVMGQHARAGNAQRASTQLPLTHPHAFTVLLAPSRTQARTSTALTARALAGATRTAAAAPAGSCHCWCSSWPSQCGRRDLLL